MENNKNLIKQNIRLTKKYHSDIKEIVEDTNCKIDDTIESINSDRQFIKKLVEENTKLININIMHNVAWFIIGVIVTIVLKIFL